MADDANTKGPSNNLTQKLLDLRTILVSGQVNEKLAERVISQLLLLDGDDSEKPIRVVVNTRRVNVDRLLAAFGIDAKHDVPGGLRLSRGDSELLPKQVVEQRGLADVGSANEGHVAAAHVVHGCSHASSTAVIMASAALFSAARRLGPRPVVVSDRSLT